MLNQTEDKDGGREEVTCDTRRIHRPSALGTESSDSNGSGWQMLCKGRLEDTARPGFDSHLYP